MNRKRRLVLQSFLVGGATWLALGSALVTSRRVWAAWPKEAFDADDLDSALQALFQGESVEASEAINLKAPDIAENGAVVPVTVSTDLDKVESISILVENNPSPLVASFKLTPGSIPEVSTRMKMGKTSNVIAIVKADGKLFSTHKEVKVTIGGCGG